MSKNRLVLTITAFAFTITSMAQTPAFPGTEGFGQYLVGKTQRPGSHVTNLNDYWKGSLREAVKGNAQKDAGIDLGGVIALTHDLRIVRSGIYE